MGQTIVNIGCWLIRVSTGLGHCYEVADVNLNELFDAVLKQKEILNLIRCSMRQQVVC